jgi:nucleotide-binding universal stress UspA family protein
MSKVRAFPSIPTKILLPIDFSPSSKAALEMATDLALHFHAELLLVNVIPFFPTSTFPDFVPEEKFLNEERNHAAKRLAKLCVDLTSKGIKAATLIEIGNDIAGNIVDVVDREHIDLVVISTHGISGWHPLIFGSIAEKVVKLVQCPLLLLRSAKPDPDQKTPAEHSVE